MDFKIGEYVVYPGKGVSTVKRIEQKDVGGKKKMFYILNVKNSQMTIFTPCDTVSSLGIRALVSQDKAREVFEYVKKDMPVEIEEFGTWNKRYREFMEMISTGDIDKVSHVVVSLRSLRKTKDLSFGERKMLEQAEIMLSDELELVLGVENA